MARAHPASTTTSRLIVHVTLAGPGPITPAARKRPRTSARCRSNDAMCAVTALQCKVIAQAASSAHRRNFCRESLVVGGGASPLDVNRKDGQVFAKDDAVLQGTVELLVLKRLSGGPMHGYG